MPNSANEPIPDLSGLEGTYQVLTDLHASPAARTYLARHLTLNRDVTVTVYRATGATRPALEQLAADAGILAGLRHENIIPVLEGRWLDDGTFALVRARIRGSTLDQVMSAVGPMPAARAAATLRQVHAALEFARANGVVQRDVTTDGLVFQQGAGRAMLALDPVLLESARPNDGCTDARTIGRLATEMLTGQGTGVPGAKSLASARPDLSRDVVQRTNALATCAPGGTAPDIPAYLALLDPASAAPVQPVAASSDDAVVVVTRGAGYGVRLATAVLVIVILAAIGVFWLRNREEDSTRVSVTTTPVDTSTLSSGDVSAQPAPANPLPPGYPVIVGSATPVAPAQSIRPPVVTPAPLPTMTADSTPARAAGDTAASGDACSSPSPADQRTCFTNAVVHSDAELTRVYNSVISALRTQAAVQTTDPDPPAVSRLRSEEWRWLDQRDAACRNAGTPPLYAQARAQCYADQTASRIAALRQMLDTMPDTTGTP